MTQKTTGSRHSGWWVLLGLGLSAHAAPEALSGVKVEGGGPVTVVFQSGLGDGKEVWNSTLAQIKGRYTTVSFDRPGRGGVPLPEGSRDPCTVADEQRAMLQAAGVKPPYVLVGHSLGGLYQYVFARRYPGEVSGLVLLDPTHPRHWKTLQQEVPGLAAAVKALRLVAFSSADRREFDDQASCLDRLSLFQRLTMPTRLLVSGRFKSSERGDYEAILKPLRQDWLTLVPAPTLEVVWDSGHYIQQENPEDVADAIAQVVAQGSPSRQEDRRGNR